MSFADLPKESDAELEAQRDATHVAEVAKYLLRADGCACGRECYCDWPVTEVIG